MVTSKIANRDAREYVKRRQPFKGNNLWGQLQGPRYVVYSYVHDKPLFVYCDKSHRWYENGDRYSVTTSKHRSQTHPHPADGTVVVSRENLVTLVKEGLSALVALKLEGVS